MSTAEHEAALKALQEAEAALKALETSEGSTGSVAKAADVEPDVAPVSSSATPVKFLDLGPGYLGPVAVNGG